MATKVTGLQAALNALGGVAGPLVDASMAEAIDVISARVRARIDVHTKTGAMLRSLKVEKLAERHYRISMDDTMAPHAKFVHDGTRPHLIKPKNKRMLRWPGGGSGFVFAKSVNHPGYRGDPWFDQIAPEVQPLINAAISRKLSAAQKG